jgi:hypothetical protein
MSRANKTSQVSDYVIAEQQFFERLSTDRRAPKRVRAIIDRADDRQLLGLVEAVHNLLRGRVPLTLTQKRRLAPHAEILRQIARSRTPRSARRHIQEGGSILATVATAIIPLLIELGARYATRGSNGSSAGGTPPTTSS